MRCSPMSGKHLMVQPVLLNLIASGAGAKPMRKGRTYIAAKQVLQSIFVVSILGRLTPP